MPALGLRGGAGAASGIGSPKFVVELNALEGAIDNGFQFVRVFYFASLGQAPGCQKTPLE